MVVIMMYVRRQVFLLEEFIHLELDQDLVPEARARHPLRDEDLLGPTSQRREHIVGQRRADLGERLSSLLLLTLAAALPVGACLRLPPGLFRLTAPFPRG
jgi:hypothetical protein